MNCRCNTPTSTTRNITAEKETTLLTHPTCDRLKAFGLTGMTPAMKLKTAT